MTDYKNDGVGYTSTFLRETWRGHHVYLEPLRIMPSKLFQLDPLGPIFVGLGYQVQSGVANASYLGIFVVHQID